jgi:hypothetical protein
LREDATDCCTLGPSMRSEPRKASSLLDRDRNGKHRREKANTKIERST